MSFEQSTELDFGLEQDPKTYVDLISMADVMTFKDQMGSYDAAYLSQMVEEARSLDVFDPTGYVVSKVGYMEFSDDESEFAFVLGAAIAKDLVSASLESAVLKPSFSFEKHLVGQTNQILDGLKQLDESKSRYLLEQFNPFLYTAFADSSDIVSHSFPLFGKWEEMFKGYSAVMHVLGHIVVPTVIPEIAPEI